MKDNRLDHYDDLSIVEKINCLELANENCISVISQLHYQVLELCYALDKAIELAKK
jgi:hypothetical protein